MTPDAAGLVNAFHGPSGQFEAHRALIAIGAEAVPALREGLRSENWEVRYWCAVCLDQVADARALEELVPLIRDPHPKVRLWAVHSVACDHCKDDVRCPVDVVPMLIERVETDDNMRVRRMAVIMLGSDCADPRAVPVLERIVREEQDRKLLLHTERALRRLRPADFGRG